MSSWRHMSFAHSLPVFRGAASSCLWAWSDRLHGKVFCVPKSNIWDGICIENDGGNDRKKVFMGFCIPIHQHALLFTHPLFLYLSKSNRRWWIFDEPYCERQCRICTSAMFDLLLWCFRREHRSTEWSRSDCVSFFTRALQVQKMNFILRWSS